MGWKDNAKKAGRMFVMGGFDVANDMRKHKKLVAEGVSSTALCQAFSLGWDRDEGDPRWGAATMTLQVTPAAGGEPYAWSGDVWIRVSQAKLVEPGLNLEGHQLPVRIDPSDPDKVAVDWDAVPAGAPAP